MKLEKLSRCLRCSKIRVSSDSEVRDDVIDVRVYCLDDVREVVQMSSLLKD